MEFSLICDTYKQILTEFNESASSDPRFYTVNDLVENGVCYGESIKTLGSTAFSYYHTGLHAGEISISVENFDALELPDSCEPSIVENDLAYVRVSSIGDAKRIFKQLFSVLSRNVKPDFNCCHLFHQCSDKKRCVSPYVFSLFCEYRKKIESGTVFYGKGADTFDNAVYKDLLQWINSIPKNTFIHFSKILYSFASTKREGKSDMVYGIVVKSTDVIKHVPDSYQEQLSRIFTFEDPCEYVLNNTSFYPRKKLINIVKSARNKYLCDSRSSAEAKNIRLGGQGATNASLVAYIKKYCVEELNKIRSSYSYVRINKSLVPYLNEYMRDNHLFVF